MLLAGLFFSAQFLVIGPQALGSGLSFSVVIEHFGVDAETMEKTISQPLENLLQSQEGLKEIRSTSEFSRSRLDLVYHGSANRQAAFLNLRDVVDRFYASLPRSVQKPQILSGNFQASPVFIAAFSSPNGNLNALRNFVETEIKPKIQRLAGAGEIEIGGGELEEIKILPLPGRMAALGLTYDALAASLGQNLVRFSPGRIINDGHELRFFFRAYPADPASLGKIRILLDQGKTAALEELAEIRLLPRAPENISRVDNQEKITLYVKDNGTGRTLSLCQQATALLQPYQDRLQVEIIRDFSADFVKNLWHLGETTLICLLITMAVVFLFSPNFLYQLFLVFILPVSAFGAAALLPWFGYHFAAETLVGLAIATGLLADTVIIVAQGNRPRLLLAKPVLSANLSTMIGLSPLFVLSAISAGLPVIATIMVLGLAFVTGLSLALIPPLQGHSWQPFRLNWFEQALPHALARAFLGAGLLFRRHPLLPSVLVVTLAGFALTTFVLLPKSLDQSLTPEIVFGQIDFDNKLNLQEADKRLSRWIEPLRQWPEIKRLETFLKGDSATLTLVFDSQKIQRLALLEKLKSAASGLEGGSLFFQEGTDQKFRQVELYLTGPNLNLVRSKIAEAAELFHKQHWVSQVIFNFKDFPPAWEYRPDGQRLAEQNLSVSDLLSGFRWEHFGPVAAKLVWQQKEYDIRLGTAKPAASRQDILNLNIPVKKSSAVALGQVGQLSEVSEPDRITRIGGQRAEFFTLELKTSDLSQVETLLTEILAQVPLDKGYAFHLSPAIQEAKAFFLRLTLGFCLSLFLVFTIIAIQFNSLKLPLFIFASIPVAFSLPLGFLAVTGTGFSLELLVGFIVVSGIVTNNGIFLLEQWRHLPGHPRKWSLAGFHRAFQSRVKAMLMTSLSTILASLPLLLLTDEANKLSQALGLAIVLGVAGSLLTSFTVFPLFAVWLEKIQYRQNKPKEPIHEP